MLYTQRGSLQRATAATGWEFGKHCHHLGFTPVSLFMGYRLEFIDAEIAAREGRIEGFERELRGQPNLGRDARDSIQHQIELLFVDIDRFRQERATILDEEDLQRRSALLAQIALDRHKELDDRDFWFRRFFTTLGIANAAAFVALTSGFLQATDRAATAELVVPALTLFTAGMLFAGVLPVMLWLRGEAAATAKLFEHAAYESPTISQGARDTMLKKSSLRTLVGYIMRTVGFMAASGSALMFVFGVMTAIGTMRGLNPG